MKARPLSDTPPPATLSGRVPPLDWLQWAAARYVIWQQRVARATNQLRLDELGLATS